MNGSSAVLFVSHKDERCGVYQFGRNVANAIKVSRRYRFIYVECGGVEEYEDAMSAHAPIAVIYNYYPSTMKWLKKRHMRRFDVPHVGILHEGPQEVADAVDDSLFDFHIALDPTLLLRNPLVFKTGRLVPGFESNPRPIEALSIGSFGFGTEGKGFERLVERVQEEFDAATIRLRMPAARFGDADGANAMALAEACRKRIHKPGIQLEVHHDFVSQDELLTFLAENSLNAFLYDNQKGRGIASVIDHALAVRRPIAITRTSMFRHIYDAKPSICIEDASLAKILEQGFAPLETYANEWTAGNLVWDYERIMNTILGAQRRRGASRSTDWIPGWSKPVGRLSKGVLRRGIGRVQNALGGLRARLARPPAAQVASVVKRSVVARRYVSSEIPPGPLNRILDLAAVAAYAPAIEYMTVHLPDLIARKIPRANVQQGFVLDTVARLVRGRRNPSLLCVGSYEDTAAAALALSGFTVDEVDPVLNYDLATYMTKPLRNRAAYDVVFATSVIEHVQDDEQFVKDIEALLAPDGVAVLTCDFNDMHRSGDPIPAENRRLYTRRDFMDRLLPLIPRCRLIDEPKWDCPEPDFVYGGCRYTFATLVFRKLRSR